MKALRINSAALLLALLFAFTGCSGNAPVGTSPAGAASQEADAVKTTSAPQDVSSSNVFKYYKAVTLGMTKDEVATATGLAAEEATGTYDPEGAYNYIDAEGYGVYVLYNSSMKAYSKTLLKKDYARDVAPLTAKPVTQDQCDQIAGGMPYTDVVALLGGEGVELSATATKPETVENVGPILYWANSDGSFIQIAFLPDGTAGNAMYFD
jgi:hypothetical protein